MEKNRLLYSWLFVIVVFIMIEPAMVQATCANGFGLNNLGACMPCSVTFCQWCPTNYTYCNACMNVHGASNGLCLPCAIPQCIWCWGNYTGCAGCGTYYGLSNGSDSSCISCQTRNCLFCASNFSICTQCVSGYALQNSSCRACQVGCLTCQTTSYNNCTTCTVGYYLSNTTCLKCLPNCTSCTNATSCVTCSPGYFMPVAPLCYSCPSVCLTCTYNASISLTPQCTTCAAFHTKPPLCPQICGDSITSTYACDNQLGVLWDGCNEKCQIQQEFECKVLPSQSTICAYNGNFQFNLISFERTGTYNNFKISLSIYPPLKLFNDASQEQLQGIFAFINPNIATKSVRYSFDSTKTSSDLIIECSFSADLEKQLSIKIVQIPGQFVSTQKVYTVMIPLEAEKIFFYSDFVVSIYNIGLIAASIVTGLGWFFLFFGLINQRLAGLESMIVLQFSWLPLLWLTSDLHPSLLSVFPLKYSTGYSCLFSNLSSSNQSSHYPYTSKFSMDPYLLFNNFNLCLLWEFLAAISIFVSWVKLKILEKQSEAKEINNLISEQIKNNQKGQNQQQNCSIEQKNQIDDQIQMQNQKSSKDLKKKQEKQQIKEKMSKKIQSFDNQRSQKQKEVYRLTKNYNFGLYTLMYACMFNLSNFVISSTLYFKESQAFDIASVVIFIVASIFYIVVFVLYIKNSSDFGTLTQSFKDQPLAKYHYIVYVTVIASSIALLELFPQTNWISLIILFIMCIYTLIYKPYSDLGQNYRSAFNFFVMCTWVSLGLICKYYSNQMISYGVFCMNLWALLPLTVILSFVSIIYYNRNQNYVSNENENVLIQLTEPPQVQQQQKAQVKQQILGDIPKISAKKQIKANQGRVPQLNIIKTEASGLELDETAIALVKTECKPVEISQQKKNQIIQSVDTHKNKLRFRKKTKVSKKENAGNLNTKGQGQNTQQGKTQKGKAEEGIKQQAQPKALNEKN